MMYDSKINSNTGVPCSSNNFAYNKKFSSSKFCGECVCVNWCHLAAEISISVLSIV